MMKEPKIERTSMRCEGCGADITQEAYDVNGPWCNVCWEKEMLKCAHEDMFIYQDDYLTMFDETIV